MNCPYELPTAKAIVHVLSIPKVLTVFQDTIFFVPDDNFGGVKNIYYRTAETQIVLKTIFICTTGRCLIRKSYTPINVVPNRRRTSMKIN